MNVSRFLMAAAACALVFSAVQFFGVSIYMHPEFEESRLLWRPPEEALAPLALAACVIYGFIFTFIFLKGYDGRSRAEGLREGLRFGIYATWLVVAPNVLFQYAHQPIPAMLAAKWLALGLAQNMILGAVAAIVYGTKEEGSPA